MKKYPGAMISGDSVNRDAEKNFRRGWSLIAVTALPALYLNVQLDGAAFRQVGLHSKNGAMRIGEMIAHLPLTMDIEHESWAQPMNRIYRGNDVISEDRDLYRVQLPTHAAIWILEQVNSLLPAGDRFEIYRGAGMVRGDFSHKAVIKVSGGGDLVFDSGHGRYAVIPEDGSCVTMFEMHKVVRSVSEIGNDGIGLVHKAMDWISYEPNVVLK